MLSKLELENSQALYFDLDNKLMNAYRLSQEGSFKEAIYIACANMYYMLDDYSSAIDEKVDKLFKN